MKDDSSFNKTCIVSPGLEIRRVKSFISQTGAKHVILVFFSSKPPPGSPAYPTNLMEQLADVRTRLAAALKEDVVTVGEIECPELTTEAVAAFLLALVAKLRADGAGRVAIGLGTGHTLFKTGAMIAAALDHEIELKYGHAHDYLELRAVEVARSFEGGSSAEGKLGPSLVESLEALVEFARGGGSGSTVGPTYVPALKIRLPNELELDVLRALAARDGHARSYAALSADVAVQNPGWPEKRSSSGSPGLRKGVRSDHRRAAPVGKIRSCAGRDLVLAGYVRVSKETQGDKEVHIDLTDLGHLVTGVLSKRDLFHDAQLSVRTSGAAERPGTN